MVLFFVTLADEAAKVFVVAIGLYIIFFLAYTALKRIGSLCLVLLVFALLINFKLFSTDVMAFSLH